ncbi:MAG: hypothetical protein ACMG55_06215 [Microcoleus sp.]
MKRLKPFLSLVLVIATISLITWYVGAHPAIIHDFLSVSPLVLVLVLALYGAQLAALIQIYKYTIRLTGKMISNSENILLTSYSNVINFIGPLQSGPGFRALYLNKRHGISFKKYATATLAYYVFYGVFSMAALFLGSTFWYVGFMLLLAALGLTIFGERIVTGVRLDGKWLPHLAVAALVQVLIFSLIYFVELRSIDSSITISQSLSYAGTANLSLFAALTPGAIGIREAFLVFTQSLHHISTNIIVAASIIDRAVYVSYLGILLGLGVTLHVKDKLLPKDNKS